MICGKWESYPREFAKCRRCRKAKYCGKECQSTAWSEGHRFWCSAKDVEEDVTSVGVHGNPAGAGVGAGTVGVVGHAGDHMQVQVQQQDQGDHGDLPGIHIAADGIGDGNVPIATATGGPTPTLTTTRPERRRHGMGHVVGEGDVSLHRHPAAAAPGTYGLSGPGTTGTARAELGMNRVQPHHHHGFRPRPAIRSPTNAVSDTGPSPTTATAANFGVLQQQQQQQDPMNASHLSFHIQSTTPTPSSTASSLTTEQRRAREQQQQPQQPRFMLSRRRVDTVTGVSGSPSTSTPSSTATSASLTPNQRAMVQAQLTLQEVPPNVVMTAGGGGHHHHHHHHQNVLRNQYQAQTQTQAGSSSVVGDWSMGSPVHTPLSSSSSSSSSAAAALVSSLESGPSSSSRRHHRMVNPMTRSPPLSAPPSTTVSMGSRQKVYRRQDDNGDRDEDGDEYDYDEQDGLGDDDMVLG